MGNQLSTTPIAAPIPARFTFPTPGASRSDVLKNIEAVRQDIGGWDSSIRGPEDKAWSLDAYKVSMPSMSPQLCVCLCVCA